MVYYSEILAPGKAILDQFKELRRSRNPASEVIQMETCLVRKQAHWKPQLDQIIMSMQSFGIVNKLRYDEIAKYRYESSNMPQNRNERPGKLRLFSLGAIFTTLFIGLISAFLLFIVESLNPTSTFIHYL